MPVELRILVVADDPFVRSSLVALVLGEPGLDVAGEAALDDDLERAARTYQPDVALWDLGRDPRTALDRLRGWDSTTVPTVALLADEELAAEVLGAGAAGLLVRQADAARLAATLTAVARGLTVLDEPFARGLLTPRGPMGAGPDSPDSSVEPLTPRELEVLQLLSIGLPNKGIAERLGISDHTAKFHVNAILGKLGAQGRTEAVVRAARLGLISL